LNRCLRPEMKPQLILRRPYLKRISSIEQDLLPNVPNSALDSERSSRKVRKSIALLGLALSVSTAGVLINQQNAQD